MAAEPTPTSRARDILLLQQRLSDLAGRQVVVMLTDNTSTMISARSAGDALELRLHRMFLDAPEEVIRALGRWLGGKRMRRDTVQEFIDANSHRVAQTEAQSRGTVIRTAGRVHDLQAIRDEINAAYLETRSKAPVTWGRKITRRKVRSVRLGWYDPARNLITISQRLDRSDIPRYMVGYVVFHEMLHEVLGIGERPDGKRDIHGRHFRLMEQTYPDYERALAFERKKWG